MCYYIRPDDHTNFEYKFIQVLYPKIVILLIFVVFQEPILVVESFMTVKPVWLNWYNIVLFFSDVWLVWGLVNQNACFLEGNTKFSVACITNNRVGAMVFSSTYNQQYFSYIVAVSLIGGGKWSTQRKPPTCRI